MRPVIERREYLAAILSAAIGFVSMHYWPFPEQNSLLQLVQLYRPGIFYGIRYAYLAMLFSTPYIALSMAFSLAYIFVLPKHQALPVPKLPPYPDPAGRKFLFLVLGEIHHPRRPEPVENPTWLLIPERGLYAGIAVFGAIGTGKTSGCMYPFAEQLLSYQATDKERRIGALILEVKGDFCHKVKAILEKYGRGQDYLEVSLDSPYRYNPLYNDLDAYALAYGIAQLLNNLYGKGKEPFWQQAYTNLVKFIILLHKVLYDYVTLFDVYACAINPDLIDQKIQEAERIFERRYVLIGIDAFMADPSLENYPFERDPQTNRMKAPLTEDLQACLEEHGTEFPDGSLRPFFFLCGLWLFPYRP